MSDMRFASSMEIIGHGDSVLSPSAIFRGKNFVSAEVAGHGNVY
jgi:hypothetical protein